MFAGEENSRVQAHIDGDEFSAHILTDEAEYNVEVCICIPAVSVPKWRENLNSVFFFVRRLTLAVSHHQARTPEACNGSNNKTNTKPQNLYVYNN